ncbi:DNA mismatch endonuclease Vsr [Mucilaginibacter sabulilitoris]|uniref:Very short patch repair endonuclease n=1 Tax=Mucilaginibacter sabulilitoris TaxID=1173583 RepID=A0ABZ0TL91_9SPHI|nr:DNA mismatch endonuclease Vsr [Mucilaginibacter sabulilitoris]WPU92494.1 DNA mismatch endonuclease Vsr [Mucilaginibacter sabulilitoris]
MTDTHSKEARSYNMSRIRSKDTKPEMLVRKYLFGKGFRFRLHDKKLPGKPDIVLPKYKVAILIHGCFWHSHINCKYAVIPKSNIEYWSGKISKNLIRDIDTEKKLQSLGWRIIVIWECDLKTTKIDQTLIGLLKLLDDKNRCI